MIWLGVGAAGAIGATCRFLLEHAMERRDPGERSATSFPWASYLVNPLGSFALGVLTGLGLAHGLSDQWRAVLGTGFCGAFTVVGPVTFDSLRLAVEGAPRAGAANLVLGVAVPLAAATVGLGIAGGLS